MCTGVSYSAVCHVGSYFDTERDRIHGRQHSVACACLVHLGDLVHVGLVHTTVFKCTLFHEQVALWLCELQPVTCR